MHTDCRKLVGYGVGDDRQGGSYFEIYDFSSEKHHRFDSEQDARIWLDCDRYQQTRTQEELLEKTLGLLNGYERR